MSPTEQGPFQVRCFEAYRDNEPSVLAEFDNRPRAHAFAHRFLEQFPWGSVWIVCEFPTTTRSWMGALAAEQVGRQNRRRWAQEDRTRRMKAVQEAFRLQRTSADPSPMLAGQSDHFPREQR